MLLILDKDNTLVTPKSGEKFVQNPEDQVLIPGVEDKLSAYRKAGWTVAIASNQGGVASGYKTLAEAIDEMLYAMELTGIEYAMFAPSYEKGERGEAVFVDRSDSGLFWKPVTSSHLRFRKPAGGMLVYLCSHLKITLNWESAEPTLYVGDRPEDEKAAIACGVRFMWAHGWLTRNPPNDA